jgi:hypothetical protein
VINFLTVGPYLHFVRKERNQTMASTRLSSGGGEEMALLQPRYQPKMFCLFTPRGRALRWVIEKPHAATGW